MGKTDFYKSELDLIVDFHAAAKRQGPGSHADTQRALNFIRQDLDALGTPLNVADIGCGSGDHTLLLARQLPQALITAVDLFPEFLKPLQSQAKSEGLDDRITTLEASMDALPFMNEEFDVVWSEGAIYNMGFSAGIQAWRPFIKKGGFLAVSEITWITQNRPSKLQQFWESEYPEINTSSAKIKALEEHGYSPVGYFILPPSSWIDAYYEPLRARMETFLSKHHHSELAQKVVQDNLSEYDLYLENQAYYSYGFYIARKV